MPLSGAACYISPMKWSKLKSLVEERFAESLADRLTINSTRYGNCTCGRAWLTLDGEEIANFCTRAFYNRYQYADKSKDRGVTAEQAKRYAKQPVEYGELSRQDAYKACWEFIHDLTIDQALTDSDPLIQTLAVIDSRVGKKKLANLQTAKLHPLAQKLLSIRLQTEGLT